MAWETLLGTVIALSLLIAFHEWGHFIVARRCGIGVLRFSLGFGPVLLNWRDRHGTDFSLSLLPLGGYIRMVDEREFPHGMPERFQGLAFNRRSLGQRASVIVAGPLANLLLAFLLLFFAGNLTQRGVAPILAQPDPGTPAAAAGVRAGHEIVAVDGHPVRTWRDMALLLARRLGETGWLHLSLRAPDQPDVYEVRLPIERWLSDPEEIAPQLLQSLGLALRRPQLPLLVQQVVPESPAAQAGLRAGDRLLSADGAHRSVQDWVDYVRRRPGADITVELERDGARLSLPVRLAARTQDDGTVIGRIGAAFSPAPLPESMLREYRLNPWQALVEAARRTWQMTAMTVSAFGKLLSGALSLGHLSGPVGIAQAAGAMFSDGLGSYLLFLALLSVSLGVVNLLPIPVLDGGHLLFLLGEWIQGHPLSARAQGFASMCGMLFIVAVLLATTYNDLLRW